MDGDQRKHEGSMPRSGHAARRASGRATDHFDPAIQPRGDPTGMSQPPGQAPMSYDYGYTGSSFHGGSLQSNDLQSYQSSDYARPPRAQPVSSIQQRRRIPPEAAFSYDSNMLYGFGPQGPTQGLFEVVPQYQTRSAAIDALTSQFVPQYLAPDDSAESGVAGPSAFLNAPYNQPNPMTHSNTTQSFPTNISDFTAIGSGSMNRLDQPEPQQSDQSDQSSLGEAIGRYQRILRRTFDQTRAGRLAEAGGSLVEISEWLVTNARDLGKCCFLYLFPWCTIHVLSICDAIFFPVIISSNVALLFLFLSNGQTSWTQSTMTVGSSTRIVLPTGPLFFLSIFSLMVSLYRYAVRKHRRSVLYSKKLIF